MRLTFMWSFVASRLPVPKQETVSGHQHHSAMLTGFTLVENWTRRTEIITYCVNVVDRSLEEKRTSLQDADTDPAVQRKTKGALFAEEVKASALYLDDGNNMSKLMLLNCLVRTRCYSAIRFTMSLQSRRLYGIDPCKVSWLSRVGASDASFTQP